MTKEALNLALEALEVANSCVDGYYISKGKTHLPEIELAIIAIKEALANEALDKMAENARELGLDYEPEQEPVAKFYVEHRTNACSEVCDEKGKVYATCDWTTEASKRAQLICDLLNTTPPQRTWVGMTDEEIKRIGKLDLDSNYFGLWYDFAKAIEAKLKEKNNG